jgi:hypothetical protein
VISRSRAGDVEQMALRVVHIPEVSLVGDGLDALLKP